MSGKNKWKYSRFCSKPPSVSHPDGCGGSWLAGCDPASPSPLRRDQTLSGLTHSPCSQLHARLADCISATAGGLLPHPFTPYPHLPKAGRWRDYSLLRL